MIYKDPVANREVKDGRWFAWYPVQLSNENRTAWLCYVERVWRSAAAWGYWDYYRIKEEK